MDHIRPNLGNVLFIMGVSGVTIVGGMAFMHHFSKRDVPVLSPVARGASDFVNLATNTKAA